VDGGLRVVALEVRVVVIQSPCALTRTIGSWSGRALRMPDQLEFDLDWNCRNTGPIHRFAAGYAPGLAAAEVLREEGRSVEAIDADAAGGLAEALRKVLHRLVVEERLAPWQIAVLTGVPNRDEVVKPGAAGLLESRTRAFAKPE